MALVSIKQRCQRQLQKKAGNSRSDPVVTTGQRIYRAVCSADEPEVAEAACPKQLGSIWSNQRPALIAVGISTEEVEDAGPGRVYDVTVDFSDAKEQADTPNDPGTSPNLVVGWGFETFTEDAKLADDKPKEALSSTGFTEQLNDWRWGKAIVNSAGQPFNPSVQRTYFDRVVTMERDTRTYDPNTADDFIDAINSGDLVVRYRGLTYRIAKETAWLRDWSATPQFANGVTYWHEHIEMVIRKDGWLRNVEDRGLMELVNNDNGRRRTITDDNGEPVTEEVPLDAHGKKHPGGSQNPVYYLRFPMNKKRDFGRMNIRE